MNLTDVAAFADKPLLQQFSRALPGMVSLALVIALGYQLAALSWRLYQGPEPAAVTTGSDTAAPATATPPARQDVRPITTAWLFGKTQSPAAAPVQANAPVTRLNLKLRGVLAAEPQDLALAIIANGKGGKEEIYAIGDTIQRGVTLSEIHSEHVIITRNGKAEKLVMEKSKGQTGFNRGVSRNTRSNSSTAGATSLRDIRKQIMKNPTSFGDYAVPVVVKEKGKQVGYRLKPQQKGELLQQYGILPGDIITEINGIKLDKPQNGVKALRELGSARTVNLTVKRGQSFVPLNIQLQ